ncbi:MAG TPA: ABC transporter ATP-binding protein [Mycobacteriales bacterium]|jgi:ABC-type multidrug transport system fused ATPase/permease subunit|nr:ABC transporter ATP-binding protein [Mycobacteriales bacterium]
MRRLPLPDPGIPDTRSAWRFLGWLIHGQRRTVLAGACYGIVWMLAQAVAPLVIGRALDDGIAARDLTTLGWWVGVLAVLGLVQAAAGILRHRVAVLNWLTASYRCNQLVARAVGNLGSSLTRQVGTGEIVSMVTSDTPQIGNALDISARLSGAFVSFIAVALLLLRTSVLLGLVVLLGVPLLMTAVSPLLRPMHRRQAQQRAERGKLASLGTDTIAGLRVLRGMGGERAYFERYAVQSQVVRRAGVRTGRVVSLVDAQQVLLPGIFVVLLTWLGARLAVRGDISIGDLIAFYGWAAFLVLPLRTFTEAADKVTRAYVGVSRLLRLLRAQPLLDWGVRDVWPAAGEIVDATTGLRVPRGDLMVVTCTDADAGSRLADRLGRFVDGHVTVAGVPLGELTEETVRRHVLLIDAESTLFGGPLRAELDPDGRHDDAEVRRALAVADAEEIVDDLPDGLDTVIGERGRSLSGGQRQRIVLARALLADPDVLVLVEPTSAVDAHTEARVAGRLRAARLGRTTVVVSGSPLLLHATELAALVVDDEVVAVGGRHEISRHPAFRAAIDRGAGSAEEVRT